MWRKTDEVKPSSGTSETPPPAPNVPNTASQVDSSRPTSIPTSSPHVKVATNSSGSAIIPGLKIQGEISGTADLYIDGEVQGSIRLGGAKLTVGPKGKVQADIEARAIQVEGNVRGNLKATEGIYLGAHGRAQGSLIAPRLGIEEGARVSGKVDMKRPGESRTETGAGKKTESVTIRRVAAGAGEEPESE
jgi:cytoskeletal protein CcmA (bactofilin family)